jgi:hypothetical protein
MLTGIFSTLLLPETKGRSLEDLSNENQEGFLKGKLTMISYIPDILFKWTLGVAAPVEVQDGVILNKRH